MPMIGKTIAHYKILEKIGEGGMGVVYKAEDIKLKRTVALKFLPATALKSETEKKRFIREAQAEAAIDHPNICAIYEIEEIEGQTFIAMAYIDGETLVKIIEKGPLSLTEAFDIAIQVAEGLQEAHEKGVIHRDIKPANIMLTKKGQPKIMDFGLARLSGTTRVTRTGQSLGTIAYMSPEQIKGDIADRRTDIWALGVTLYELLTGRLPFTGDYDASFLYSIVNEEHAPITHINKTLPAEVERVIDRALQKNADARYSTMQEMIADLKQIKRRFGTGTNRRIEVSKIKLQKKTFREIVIAPTIIVIAALVVFIVVILPYLRKNPFSVSIAVLEFENRTKDPGLSAILTDILINDFTERPNVRILRKEQMHSLAQELGIQKMDLSAGFDICHRASIQYIVAAGVLQIGTNFSINANVFDTDTQDLLFSKEVRGKGDDEIFDMTDKLSKEIRSGLNLISKKQSQIEPKTAELLTGSKKAYEFYQIARNLHSHGDLEEYIAALKQAAGIDSTFVKAYQDLAVIYDYLENSQAARRYARRAVEFAPGKSPQEYRKSLIISYHVNGDVGIAVDHMKKYLDDYPHDVDMHLRLGYVLSRFKKEFEESIVSLKKVKKIDPDNLSGTSKLANNYLGHAYLYINQFDKAIESLQEYQLLAPQSPDPPHSMADAYRLTGDYREAIERYNEIVSTDPSYLFSYEGLGLAYLALGKWKQALNAFTRYCNIAPESKIPYGHFLMGWVYLLQEDYISARNEAEFALSLHPPRFSSYWLRGMIALASDERIESAKEILGTMDKLRMDPGIVKGFAYYHHLQGRILLAEGKYTEGLRALRKAVDVSLRDESAFFEKELARGYMTSGKIRNARESIEHIQPFNDNDAEVFILFGEAYEKDGAMNESEYYFKKAANVWQEADNNFRPLELIKSKLAESF